MKAQFMYIIYVLNLIIDIFRSTCFDNKNFPSYMIYDKIENPVDIEFGLLNRTQ
jgi:hypothetical protein